MLSFGEALLSHMKGKRPWTASTSQFESSLTNLPHKNRIPIEADDMLFSQRSSQHELGAASQTR